MKTVGLALGGGAARGFAHVGVVKVLQEKGTRIDYIAGTSVGSLIGSLYAAGFSWRRIAEVTDSIRWRNLLSFRPCKRGLFVPDKLEKRLNLLLEGKSFEELPIPFAVTAVDINTGKQVVIDKGNVARAVRASCSVPGIFLPVEMDGMLLIDGGIRNSIPADVVSGMGADLVVAVNLNGQRVCPEKTVSALRILRKTLNILADNNVCVGLSYSDIIVEPATGDFGYGSLRPKDELFRRGEAAMEAKIAELQNYAERGVKV